MSDYIIFDLDGTLTDSKEGITTCVQYALAAFGIEEDIQKLTPFIGPPLKDSFMEFYDFTEAQAEEAIAKYRERFADTGIFETRVYDGVPEMLRKLKGNRKKLAVASSKPAVFVERILEHFDIRRYFDVVVGSELDGTRTDKKEVLEETMRLLYGENAENLKEKKKNTVMVGDRRFDVRAAKECGIGSIAVTYGYGPMDELKIAKPDYYVGSVEDLTKLLLRGSRTEPTEAPLKKVWFVLFPVLAFYFTRELGAYVGIMLLQILAGTLPKNFMGLFVYWNEENVLEGLTGNGSAVVTAIAFLAAAFVSWKYFAKEDILAAQKEIPLRTTLVRGVPAYAAMVIGTIGFCVGFNFLYDVLGLTNSSEAYRQVAENQYAASIPVGLVLNGLLVPVIEEMVFRGVLYNRLKQQMKYIPAILVSALFFGVYHQNIVQGSYAFLMGCMIAFFYECFGQLYVPVLVHAISNIAAYLLTVTGSSLGISSSVAGSAILLLLGAAGTGYVGWLHGRIPVLGKAGVREKET